VVANNLDIFVRLAQGKPLAAERTLLTTEEVLVGIRQSTEFLYNKSALARRIGFEVRKAPGYPARWSFWGTRNLIELAVDNLLDNAVKYSFADTIVVIEADPALYGKQVCFSFRNQGLKVSPGDAPRLAERRFRGPEAQVTSPEGTGIGLWMVAEIMRAMKGRLEALPTNQEGWNEFRLYFEGKPE
jgi:signal transduction histidine kinase